nr:eukaryotic translation initiation factor 3 subunit B-like [Tanacetum cinerariifolium]
MTVMVVLNIFDVRTGKVIRGLKESTDEIASGVIAGFTRVSWLVIRWGVGTEDKYFARLGKIVISIYETETLCNASIAVDDGYDPFHILAIQGHLDVSIKIIASRVSHNAQIKKNELAFATATDEDGLFVGGPLYDDINYRIEASKKMLHVPNEEFSKFAFVYFGNPRYLQDSDVVSTHFKESDVYNWEENLGLEHLDNAFK